MDSSHSNHASKYLPLAEIRALVPGNPHTSTIHRWRLRGVRGVKLQTVLIGGRRFVTPAAVDEFLAKINEQKDVPAASDAPGNNLSSAESFLDKEGV